MNRLGGNYCTFSMNSVQLDESLQCPCTQAFVFADVFTVQNGLKQGDILSLFLFNYFFF
jgi:hypothetical protein